MIRRIRWWHCWRLGDWRFNLWDWSLARRDWSDPIVTNHWLTVFGGIRCGDCGAFALGCRDHWFCGLCEPCRAEMDRAEAEAVE